MEKVILEKIRTIEEKEQVKILFAIESGSRAWGFESPDSDYDVRFVYLRQTTDYLRLDPLRDVIEWQLDDTLDINGWDLQKALRLVYKGNPVFFEWLNSPIAYHRDPALFPQLKEVCEHYFSKKKALYHYWHMCDKNYHDYLQKEQVKLKKYFYALRPVWAAKWIQKYGTIPPVKFDTLKEEMCPPDLAPVVDDLLKQKVAVNETELILPIPALSDYLRDSLDIMKKDLERISDDKQSWDELNLYFQSLVLEVE